MNRASAAWLGTGRKKESPIVRPEVDAGRPSATAADAVRADGRPFGAALDTDDALMATPAQRATAVRSLVLTCRTVPPYAFAVRLTSGYVVATSTITAGPSCWGSSEVNVEPAAANRHVPGGRSIA